MHTKDYADAMEHQQPRAEKKAYLDFIKILVDGRRVPVQGFEALVEACPDIIDLLPHQWQLHRQDGALYAVPDSNQELQGADVAAEGSGNLAGATSLAGGL